MQISQLFTTLLAATLAICAGCATAERTIKENNGHLIYLPADLEIELALAAGPEHIRAEASVYIFGPDGYTKVRGGTNGVTCLVNRDGHQRGDYVLRPTCWDAEGSATIVPMVLRVGEMIAQGASVEEISRDIDKGFRNKRFISPRKTGIAYMLKGDVIFDAHAQKVVETVFPAHYMIYAPGVSNADIGTTDEALQKNPSLPLVYDGYSGGARTAYIIITAPDAGPHIHK